MGVTRMGQPVVPGNKSRSIGHLPRLSTQNYTEQTLGYSLFLKLKGSRLDVWPFDKISLISAR